MMMRTSTNCGNSNRDRPSPEIRWKSLSAYIPTRQELLLRSSSAAGVPDERKPIGANARKLHQRDELVIEGRVCDRVHQPVGTGA